MKKAIKAFMAIAIMFVATACSSGWNADKAKEIVDAANNGTITESQWNTGADLATTLWNDIKPIFKKISEGDFSAMQEVNDLDSKYVNGDELMETMMGAYGRHILPEDAHAKMAKIVNEISSMSGVGSIF